MMLAHGIALTQTNGERLNPMKIYPTYTSGDCINGTVIIGGIRGYYSGTMLRMSQLNLAYYSHELSNATRVKPYEDIPNVQK